MCTVTYIPANEIYFLTSNRDEKNVRKEAIVPNVYEMRGKKLVFPRDADAGGSWIALHENGNAAVLLNGAFERHVPEPPYRLSRGQIFLNVISNERPVRHFHHTDLQQIEPFTLVVLEKENLYECRWDGRQKHFQQLKKHRPYIWSSVTLYDYGVIKKRQEWFARFLNSHAHPTQKDILAFHRFTGDGDAANSLLMERGDVYSTVSITSMLITADRGSMKYEDVKNNITYEKKIEFEASIEIL